MDIGEAIGFAFEDEQWVGKLLLGAAITLIPIFGGLMILGYGIAVIRSVKAGKARPLPSWDDVGRYFVDGLMFWIATSIYAIPLLVLLCPTILVWILPAVAGDNQDLTAILTGISGIVSVGFGCLATLYAILLWLLTPVLQIRYAEAGELEACLRFGEVFRFLSDNIGGIIIAQLVIWAAGLVVTSILGGMVGVLSIIPICGWLLAAVLGLLALPVGVWLTVFSSHLYGQIGRSPETALV